MNRDDARVGARVTYDDEGTPVQYSGTIRTPTDAELADAADWSARVDPIGPEHGDVLVQWDGDGRRTRFWQDPADLRLLPDEAQPTLEED